MKNTHNIREIFNQGLLTKALQEIKELLKLGPSNLAALKMKSAILLQKGRFYEASITIAKLVELAPDDEEVIEKVISLEIEEAERLYFTEILPSGGIRFITYHQDIADTSLLASFGSLFFLLSLNNWPRYNLLASNMTISLFAFIVIVIPWVLFLFKHYTSVHSISVDLNGIRVHKRSGGELIKTRDIENIYIVQQSKKDKNYLSAVIVSKNKIKFEIDLSKETSILKARSFFISMLQNIHKKVHFTSKYPKKLNKMTSIFK
jgi:hypothetical protein